MEFLFGELKMLDSLEKKTQYLSFSFIFIGQYMCQGSFLGKLLLCVFIHIYTYFYMCRYTYVYLHIYTYMLICTCIYIYAYM